MSSSFSCPSSSVSSSSASSPSMNLFEIMSETSTEQLLCILKKSCAHLNTIKETSLINCIDDICGFHYTTNPANKRNLIMMMIRDLCNKDVLHNVEDGLYSFENHSGSYINPTPVLPLAPSVVELGTSTSMNRSTDGRGVHVFRGEKRGIICTSRIYENAEDSNYSHNKAENIGNEIMKFKPKDGPSIETYLSNIRHDISDLTRQIKEIQNFMDDLKISLNRLRQ